MRTLVIIMLFAILASLASAGVFLLRDRGNGNRTALALTLRISLSVVLFIALMLGIRYGYITHRL